MYKKSLGFQLTLWMAVYFFTSSLMKAEEDSKTYQRAFYALSSLTFYLDQTIADISPHKKSTLEKIKFSESDVAQLWHTASFYPAITSELQKAQEYYYEAVKQHQDQTVCIELCKKAHGIVQAAWHSLNPYTAKEKPTDDKRFRYPHFDDNPYITSKMRKRMRPYLLPPQNKLKASLDTIFNPSRVMHDKKSFAKAGFITLFDQKRSRIKVAKHPALKGYLLKVYFDGDVLKDKAGWDRFTERCQGARNVQRLIKEKNLEHFSAPDKWLYPPVFSNIPPTTNPKSVQPVVLVVTDMNLVSIKESENAWKKKVTHTHLDELFCILSHGFASQYLPYNIPYTKNGKFACIDTEYPQRTYANFDLAKESLAPEMKTYWDHLVRTGGK
jgi:hypothetical protein